MANKKLLVVGYKTGNQMAVPTEMDQDMLQQMIDVNLAMNQPLVAFIVVNKLGDAEPLWINLNEIHFITLTNESMIQAPPR